ncbi:MAG: transglycosylase SLT domain-containing protein, partial [Bdellovibrio sp.]
MRFYLVVCLFALSACSQMSSRTQSSSPRSESGTADGTLQVYRSSDSGSQRLVDPELETIPTEMNSLVEKWIAYFQGRGRPHMERYLARSTRYSGIMRESLRRNGLPEDLIYIALIESGFSSRATSRAAAVGYWQFIRGTGRRYSLEINSMIDERRDPILSTQAAAEYFKGLYSVFGSWYLAMASYNVGENRVKREVMNHYTRDFWELARKKRFPKETINYVPKFIAAKLIGRNPEKYGFANVDYEKPLEFETLRVNEPVNLRKMSEVLGLEYEDLKALNPKFKGEIAPLKNNAHLDLRLPLGMHSQGIAAAQAAKVEKVEFIADSGETDSYRVRSGDSLYIIAKRYRTTVAWLKDANDLKAGRKLRVGQRILVPERSGVSSKKAAVMVVRGPKPAEERSAKEVAQKSPEMV